MKNIFVIRREFSWHKSQSVLASWKISICQMAYHIFYKAVPQFIYTPFLLFGKFISHVILYVCTYAVQYIHVLKFGAPHDVENLKFWIYVPGWGNFFFSLSFFEFALNYYNSRFLWFKALTFVKNGLMWVLLLIKYLQWIMFQRWKWDRARMNFSDGWYFGTYEESLWIWAHQRCNEIKSSSSNSTLSYFWITNLQFNFDRKMEWGSRLNIHT